MRWPIQIQLLLWMLAVVVFGIVAATLAGAYLAVDAASQRQLDDLHKARDTLSRAHYPLSQTVLEHISGLSGGEFVLLDERGKSLHGTIDIAPAELASLRAIPEPSADGLFTSGNVVRIGGRDYFGEQVRIGSRAGTADARRLVVLYPKHQWWSVARSVAAPILAAGGVTTAAAMLVSVLVAGRFVRPIRVLRNQADEIADGRFVQVDSPRRNDEIGDLTRSINRMTQRLGRYEEEVRRNERLRVLGQLGAGIAHQLRNAAAGATMAVELHQRETPGAADDESLGIALRQLRLMESHLQRFLSLGRMEPSDLEPIDLETLVDDVVSLVGPACRHGKIALDVACSRQPIRVEGDRHWLGQLLTNLVLNAMEAAGRRATPEEPSCPAEVRIEVDRDAVDWAVLRVKNTGPPPDASIRDRLFEPFVTDKPDGTGLGLYLVRQVAEDHGGAIDWARDDKTTCFTVRLPLERKRGTADERG
ncbi:MAG: HAMP domain-containing histidine kinase [Pirellulaceae bacterium]|nr:HAMP domain-containing histidine kinase [Pirellulaceae bacterium]